MGDSYHTKNGRTSKRGAFIDGVWHCDCDPRMPAEKFQTKNGGKNHGRWFYTCQKPQPKRCSFFLWSDDAKIREESAVINNSRTEPQLTSDPKTPKKMPALAQPPTPLSKARSQTLSPESPRRKLWSPTRQEDLNDETFNWSSSGDEELASIAEAVIREDDESPRKTARILHFDSPRKRMHAVTAASSKSDQIWPFSNDVFLTPQTLTNSNGLLSPLDTQLKASHRNPILDTPSSLSSEVLHLLKSANISSQIELELVDLLNRYDLRTQGIARGRDITRLAVQTKDKKIAELQARIAALEAEKETSRTVIAHLKQDIATSPKKQSRSKFGSRSEI